MRPIYLWAWGFLLVSHAAFAQDAVKPGALPEMIPADMGPGPNPWNGLVRFPEGTEDVSVFVRCQGGITDNGRINDSHCYTDEEDHWRFTAALDRILGTARVKPAVVDGRKRAVITVFSFLFVRKNQKETIVLFQNDLSNRDELGFAYVAPQLYSWRVAGSGQCGPKGRYFRVYRVHVDGTADVELPTDNDNCQARWDAVVASMQFIPAQLNGKPVEAELRIANAL